MDAGFEVIGPARSLEEGTRLAEEEEGTFFACLDVNLNGDLVFPLARALRDRGIPFILLTGFQSGDLPDDLADVRLLSKPVAPEDVIEAIRGAGDA